MHGSTPDEEAARTAREAMAATMSTDWEPVTSPAVLAALRTVPRERFVPAGTPLAEVYDPAGAILTRHDDLGNPTSSVSAPHLQGLMIEQAEIGPGDRVLEIGSGGYNAALIAEVVGETGSVVTIDIDPWVTDHASRYLADTGYDDRVTVVTGDGELPVEGGPYDAIIVTVGAWDVPPAWIEELSPEGRLVVPLRVRSLTRAIAFRREGDHLVSVSAYVCGFVPMQGIGKHTSRPLPLTGPEHHQLTLHFDDQAPPSPELLGDALLTPAVDVWTGRTVGTMEDFSGLNLWLACHLDGFCQVIASRKDAGGVRSFPYGTAVDDSLAVLVVRDTDDAHEFGARGYGPHARDIAARMARHIQDWDQHGRPADPAFGYWPDTSDRTSIPADAVVLPKSHGVVTVSW